MTTTFPPVSQDLLRTIGPDTLAAGHPLKHNVALEILAKLVREKGEIWAAEHTEEVRKIILSITSII